MGLNVRLSRNEEVLKTQEELSDEELMNLYCRGDRMAYETLYLRHKARIWSYFYKRLAFNQSVAEELFQEAFLRLHKSRRRYRLDQPFLPWFFTICRNLLIDHYRKKKEITVAVELTELTQAPEIKEVSIDESYLHTLTERERELLKLRFEEDLDYKEVALALNITPTNARKIGERALKKIRNFFFKKEEGKL